MLAWSCAERSLAQCALQVLRAHGLCAGSPRMGQMLDACKSGDVDKVEAILNRGTDVDTRLDIEQWTALMIACKRNHMAIVRLLVDRGANVNLQNKSASFLCLVRADLRTMPCISRACARSLWIGERWDLSRVLFAAQVRIIDFSRYDSARESVWRCHIWGWSIDWFPEIASPSRGGWSSLMIASKHGHDQIVEYLVEKGANVNAVQQSASLLYFVRAWRWTSLCIT